MILSLTWINFNYQSDFQTILHGMTDMSREVSVHTRTLHTYLFISSFKVVFSLLSMLGSSGQCVGGSICVNTESKTIITSRHVLEWMLPRSLHIFFLWDGNLFHTHSIFCRSHEDQKSSQKSALCYWPFQGLLNYDSLFFQLLNALTFALTWKRMKCKYLEYLSVFVQECE